MSNTLKNTKKIRSFIKVDTEKSFNNLDKFLDKLENHELIDVIIEFNPIIKRDDLKDRTNTELAAITTLQAINDWEKAQAKKVHNIA